MTIRKISALVPATLFALTVLAVQTSAFADETDIIEQASVATTSVHSDAQGTFDPQPESLGD